jgi:hypothetical protein
MYSYSFGTKYGKTVREDVPFNVLLSDTEYLVEEGDKQAFQGHFVGALLMLARELNLDVEHLNLTRILNILRDRPTDVKKAVDRLCTVGCIDTADKGFTLVKNKEVNMTESVSKVKQCIFGALPLSALGVNEAFILKKIGKKLGVFSDTQSTKELVEVIQCVSVYRINLAAAIVENGEAILDLKRSYDSLIKAAQGNAFEELCPTFTRIYVSEKNRLEAVKINQVTDQFNLDRNKLKQEREKLLELVKGTAFASECVDRIDTVYNKEKSKIYKCYMGGDKD